MSNELATTTGGELAEYTPDKFNVLTPIVAQQDIPQGARLSVRIVKVDPTPKKGDVYQLPTGQLCLTKVALDRMAAAAGITVLDVSRVDDRTVPHVYGFKARVSIMDPDGLRREGTGTKEVDYRDDGKDAAGKSPGDLRTARKFASELCASKALNRALRQCLAIKSSYTSAELSKPYAVAKLILDSNDADSKAALLANMTNAQAQLYPPAGRGSAGEDITVEAQEEKAVEEVDPNVMLADVWKYAEEGGVPAATFKRLANESGKKRSELTKADVQTIADKCAVIITEIEESKTAEPGDGVPF